jgi:hypothetical protein
VPASFVVDQRLAWEPQIDDDIIPNAKNTGRKVFIYDIDCPLRLSLMGVLKRPQGGEDPIPPFGAVAYGGYVPIVANRGEIMSIFKGEELKEFTDALGEYVLFATKADYSKVKVMSIKDKAVKVESTEAERFTKMEGKIPKKGQGNENLENEVTKNGQLTIDSTQIKHVCGGMQADFASACGLTLCPWIGVSWRNAVDSWAGLSDATARKDESKCQDKSVYDESTLFGSQP